MSNYTHDIVATIGTYTDREGNEKKRFNKCGAAFTNDDGNLSIKIDAMPVSPEWNGWLSLYEKKEFDNQASSRPQPARQQPVAAAADDGDEIPF